MVYELLCGTSPLTTGRKPPKPKEETKKYPSLNYLFDKCTRLDPHERPTASSLLQNYVLRS